MQYSPNPLARRFNLEFFSKIPRDSGVYFFRSARGEILYVGKAKNLRSRLLSYRYARWGTVGENILGLLEHVRKIDWELCATEEQALLRERELIRALVPRYNVADAWEEDYLYIGLRVSEKKNELIFRLTDREDSAKGYRMHGCYRHRRRVKESYGALLRVFTSTTLEQGLFSLPAEICQRSPAYDYSLEIGDAPYWRSLTSSFLHGKSRRLLPALVEAMLRNENIPAYARPALQRDLKTLQSFAESCLSGVDEVLSQEEMREFIRASVPDSRRKVA